MVNAPIVQAHAQVEQKGIAAREVKIEEARQCLAVKHHVVAEQVGMHRATWQGLVGAGGSGVVLESQLGLQQVCRVLLQVGQDRGHGGIPPRQATQIGLFTVVVLACQVHVGQHATHGGAVHGRRLQLALAAQLLHDGSRLAAHLVQDVTGFFIGLGIGHGDALVGQVLHQVEIKRQLLGAQALEQSQYPLSLIGCQEVVGVFNTTLNTAQRGELAQGDAAQQIARVFVRDFGKNGHAQARKMKNLLWLWRDSRRRGGNA